MEKQQVSMAEWQDEGTRRFGPNIMDWKFVCPSCGHVASFSDWAQLGAPQNQFAFSCVGNWMAVAAPVGASQGPCVYQGSLGEGNPMAVVNDDGTTYEMFSFAEPDPAPLSEAS